MTQAGTKTPKRSSQLVEEALWEAQKNYREASLSRVAQKYGVSLAYVSECVRRETSRTFKDHLHKYRLEQAARLLRRSSLSVKQIIAEVGYANTSYFCRLFHQRYGQTPQEYRRAHIV